MDNVSEAKHARTDNTADGTGRADRQHARQINGTQVLLTISQWCQVQTKLEGDLLVIAMVMATYE